MDLNKRWLFLIILFSILIRIPFLNCPLFEDEGEYAYQAYFWLKGVNPYQSRFFFTLPGYPLLYFLVFKFFCPKILAIRIFLAVWNAGIIIFIYLIARKLISPTVGLVSAFLYGSYSWLPLIRGNVGKEIYMMLPLCTALYLYVLYREYSKKVILFLSGIFLGLAVLFKQSALPLSGFFLVFICFESKHKIRDVIMFLIAASLPIIGCFIYGSHCIGIRKFFYCVISYRLNTASIFCGTWWYHILRGFRSMIKSGIIFWLIPLILNIKCIKKGFTYYFLIAYLFFSFLGIALSGSWYANYWALILPSVCILLAWEIVKILQTKKKSYVFKSGLWLILPFFIYILISLHFHNFCLRFYPEYQLTPKIAHYLKKNSNETDKIYAFLYRNAEIYFLARRRSSFPSLFRPQMLYRSENIKEFINHIETTKRPSLLITYTEERTIKIIRNFCELKAGIVPKLRATLLGSYRPFCKNYPSQISFTKELFALIPQYYVKVKTISVNNASVIIWKRK